MSKRYRIDYVRVINNHVVIEAASEADALNVFDSGKWVPAEVTDHIEKQDVITINEEN